MIVHNQVCDYCDEQIELPTECEEDRFLKSSNANSTKIYGISMDIMTSPTKSFEGYRRRNTRTINLTFCSKICSLEYIKKTMTDEGVLEMPK